jgi:hypothetical protein
MFFPGLFEQDVPSGVENGGGEEQEQGGERHIDSVISYRLSVNSFQGTEPKFYS